MFYDGALDRVAESPTPVRWLLVASETATSIDVTADGMLADLDNELHQAGMNLADTGGEFQGSCQIYV
jgi:hypothetical protein